jgi:hypothetical protein
MNEKRKKIHFTIDGTQYETRDDDQEAAQLLRLAGLNPDEFDLAKVKRNGETKTYKDRKVVDIDDGDRFVTVRHSAPVA